MAGSSSRGVTDLQSECARLQLDEEEEGGLEVAGEEDEDNGQNKVDSRFCLVGLDVRRILDTGLWTFDQHILLVHRLGADEQPHNVPLFHTTFWIQVYNMPLGFQSERILQSIGNYIGSFLESDKNNLKGVWRNYMRLRVSLDVRKPLKRRMRLKRTGGEWFWVDFKYERLNVFCFICGILSHTERNCPTLYDSMESNAERPYGTWMKAPPRRGMINSGERWLRSEPPRVEEDKLGNWSQSGVGTIVGEDGTTTSAKYGSKLRGKEKLNSYGPMDLEIAKSDITCNQMGINGKDMGDSARGMVSIKSIENSYDSQLIISEAKRRRSNHGSLLIVGQEEVDNLTQLENVNAPKNGPAGEVRSAENPAGLHWLVCSGKEGKQWRVTGFYGFPESSRRRESWNLMRSLASSSSLPWVCLGDFNDLLHSSEKQGKHAHPNWKMHGFQKAVTDSGLFDLGMSGYQFTWERSRGSEDWVEERLDRALASNSWLHLFPKAKVSSLEASCYDHLPIFLDPNLVVNSPRIKKFRFENTWLREADCIEIVKGSWSSSVGMPIQSQIEACGSALLRWGNHFSRDFRARLLDCKKKMVLLRARKKQNAIGKLRNSQGQWCTNPEGINEIIANHFTQIFSTEGGLCDEALQWVESSISAEQNLTLLENFSTADVREAIFSMHPDKSLGPDANRLKLVLGSIISESQSAFIPGRSITDNVMISAEVMHYLKRKRQGREGAAALKIDMSKAYDRIEWNFLSSIMLKMGFSSDFVKLIMLCVSTVTYKIPRDGLEIGPIAPSRGLRQGDPLSPYLFIICAQGLSSLINHYERAGLLHGIRIARGAPCLTHLFFADDCFLFFKASDKEASVMKVALTLYGAASGQRVNFDKSSISFSANTNKEVEHSICSLLGVRGTVNHGNYLGLPSFIGRSKSAVFRYIRERIWKRLQGWNQKLLSRAGKEILLKTVAQALPIYAMNTYLLPMELCREIERMMNSFWWGRKGPGSGGIIWMKWDRMCKPKTHGGIGFKRLHMFNVAMLGKQGWRLLTNPNILVARLFKARYYPNTSFAEARLGNNPSYVWRSILTAPPAIIRGSRIQIGGGRQTVIGSAPWLPDKDNSFISSTIPANITAATVDSLMVPNQRKWDYDVVKDIFNGRDRDLIFRIPLGSRRDHDTWFWLPDSKGLYTVRSYYRMLDSLLPPPSSSAWRKLWQLPVPAKVKNFLWRAMANVIPTSDNLLQRRVEVQTLCPICHSSSESILHILVTCHFAKSCWISSVIGFNGTCLTFVQWMEDLFGRCTLNDCSLAGMICWGLWLNRNNKVWKSVNGRVQSVLNVAAHGSVCWEKPGAGWYKCNVDAALVRPRGLITFGAVIRSAGGEFIAAKSNILPGSFDPREAEALGVKEALSWLKNFSFKSVVLEMDSLLVFNALHDKLDYPNGFGSVIADCRALAQSLGEVAFSFVRRSANSAAHTVARVGSSLSGAGEWSFVPPPWLCNSLAA
ncbi:reverse transcriptase domain-containing protein [Citrus sinensis]|nr:reverse transcriptase domain-containing protein [Citrus sinensis]